MYRTQLPARKTLLYAGEIKLKAFVNIINSIRFFDFTTLIDFLNNLISALSLILYPIVPVITYAVLLWRTPQNMARQQNLQTRLKYLEKIGKYFNGY